MSTKKLKLFINVFTVVALAFLIFVSRGQIAEAFSQLADLSLWLLILQLPLQFLSYAAVAHMYYSYLRNLGKLNQLGLKDMYKTSLELNFVNSVFPSGGVSGFSYLSLRLKPFGISVATSTLSQVVRFVLTFVSFLLVLGLGLLLLAIGNQVSNLIILFSGSFFFLVVSGLFLGLYIISAEGRIKAFVAFIPKSLNYVFEKLLHKKDHKCMINVVKIENIFAELHRDYVDMSSDIRCLKGPFIYALLTNIFELATIYVVYIAFGSFINPGALILAYAVANFAGLIAILPGGIGVYESLMVAVLSATGVPQGLAISATLVYRVINLLVFVPIGLVLYQMALLKGGLDKTSVGAKVRHDEAVHD